MSETILGGVLFNQFLLTMLALDRGMFHRSAHEVRLPQSFSVQACWQ